mgnify:FL=1
MKRAILILCFALISGALAFFAMRSQRSSNQGVLLDQMPELVWLRNELDLSDAEFKKVEALHISYRPRCAEFCHRIHETHAAVVSTALKGKKMNLDLEEAIDHHSHTAAECQKEMLKHVYETASILPPDKAKIYLQRVLPYTLKGVSEPFRSH